MNNEIQEAMKNLRIAQQQESLADPDYIEIAIEQTNLAKAQLDLLIRKQKLNSVE